MLRQSIHCKRSKQAMHCVYVDTVKSKIKACIALNFMYVDTVDTDVCGFYTEH